jgi:hypothetical protein
MKLKTPHDIHYAISKMLAQDGHIYKSEFVWRDDGVVEFKIVLADPRKTEAERMKQIWPNYQG